jgi:hypothetical protein
MHKAERTCTSVYAGAACSDETSPECLHELAASQAAAGSIRSKGFQDCKASSLHQSCLRSKDVATCFQSRSARGVGRPLHAHGGAALGMVRQAVTRDCHKLVTMNCCQPSSPRLASHNPYRGPTEPSSKEVFHPHDEVRQSNQEDHRGRKKARPRPVPTDRAPQLTAKLERGQPDVVAKMCGTSSRPLKKLGTIAYEA